MIKYFLNMNHYRFAILLLVFLFGCTASPGASPLPGLTATGAVFTASTPILSVGSQTAENNAGESSQTPGPGQAVAATLTPMPGTRPLNPDSSTTPSPAQPVLVGSATPDLRLSPDSWRDWAYMPTLSPRALALYRKGIELGRDPHHFSVVGDCQAIPLVFLGAFDRKTIKIPDGLQDLQKTIVWFAGSFNREGLAVRGGYTAASILAPLQADPQQCQPGETPLDCDLRIYNPSIVLVNLETWAKPATIDRYEGYLRKILDRIIEYGALPVLATKADAAEVGAGKHVINPIVAKLAYEYDLPLWNFWRSAQYLPDRGIDPEREGFHMTQAGWDLKSVMALQVLDLILRTARQDYSTPTPMPTSGEIRPSDTPTPQPAQASPTPSQTPTTIPFCTAGSGADCVYFGLVSRQADGSVQPAGVFLYELSSQQMAQVAPQGYNLQDVSPDYKSLLINQGADLYIVPSGGGDGLKITDRFFGFGKQGAYWMKDGQSIILVADRQGENAVWLYKLADQSFTSLSAAGESPIYLYPSPSLTLVYWEKGTCTAKDFCTGSGVWSSPLDGKGQSLALQSLQSPVFSADGTSVAFLDAAFKSESWYLYNNKLLVEKVDQPLTSRRLLTLAQGRGFMVSTRLLSATWSPDSSQLFILADDYSDYFERSLLLRPFIFYLKGGMIFDCQRFTGAYGSLKPQVAWSPDGLDLLIAGANILSGGEFQLAFNLMNVKTRSGKFLDQNPALISEGYRYVSNIYWVVP